MIRPSGLTLLELIIVMAILGMTLIAAPAMRTWTRQDVGLAKDQFCADIQLARIMAIKHRQRCAIVLHAPGPNRYMNSISRQWADLSRFKGGVHFLEQGPDGHTAASEIAFNQQGMSTSVVPREVFLADRELRSIFRVRVMLAGGISVHRWGGGDWQ